MSYTFLHIYSVFYVVSLCCICTGWFWYIVVGFFVFFTWLARICPYLIRSTTGGSRKRIKRALGKLNPFSRRRKGHVELVSTPTHSTTGTGEEEVQGCEWVSSCVHWWAYVKTWLEFDFDQRAWKKSSISPTRWWFQVDVSLAIREKSVEFLFLLKRLQGTLHI